MYHNNIILSCSISQIFLCTLSLLFGRPGHFRSRPRRILCRLYFWLDVVHDVRLRSYKAQDHRQKHEAVIKAKGHDKEEDLEKRLENVRP